MLRKIAVIFQTLVVLAIAGGFSQALAVSCPNGYMFSAGADVGGGACVLDPNYCVPPTVFTGFICEIKCGAGSSWNGSSCVSICPAGYNYDGVQCQLNSNVVSPQSVPTTNGVLQVKFFRDDIVTHEQIFQKIKYTVFFWGGIGVFRLVVKGLVNK